MSRLEGVCCSLMHVARHMHYTSHVSLITIQIKRHTSRVAHHTSHVTRHTSHVASEVSLNTPMVKLRSANLRMGGKWRDDNNGEGSGDFNVNKEYPLRNTTLIKWRNCPLCDLFTYELSCIITHAYVSVLEEHRQRVLQRSYVVLGEFYLVFSAVANAAECAPWPHRPSNTRVSSPAFRARTARFAPNITRGCRGGLGQRWRRAAAAAVSPSAANMSARPKESA